MSEETNLLVQEYTKNPLHNHSMTEYTVKKHEGNFICGDDITVYLVIENDIIKDYSYDGNCSNITTAAASFLSEYILGANIHEVLNWTYTTVQERGFEVSPRRKRAAIISIMAARNAIHEYLKDGQKETFDDLMDD